jgi:hypothetical protein
MTTADDYLGIGLDDAADIAARITALGGYASPRASKGGRRHWKIQCPHPDHPDTNPSASLSDGRDGRPLLHCWGRCADVPGDVYFRQVMARLRDGTTFAQASPRATAGGRGGGTLTATYRYFDAEGREYHKVRYDYPGGKRFEWRTMSGGTYVTGLTTCDLEDLLPYGRERLTGSGVVYWVEGEKDADRLWALGEQALSSPGGATGPMPDLSCLHEQVVCIIADRDQAGKYHMEQVRAELERVGATAIRVTGPKPMTMKSDVSDHLDAGYGLDELQVGVEWYVPGGAAPDEAPLAAYEAATVEPEPRAPGHLPETFWGRHDTLTAIRRAAKHRLLRPEPVLVACLVTAATCISPLYVLPPIVGAPASLNLFGLMYGATGMGKSTSMTTGRNLLGVTQERWDSEMYAMGQRGIDVVGLYVVKLGSGEGIAHAYAERIKEVDDSGPKAKTTTRLARVRDHALIWDAEGSALVSHMNRTGSTLGQVLLSAFSGESLLSAVSKRGADKAVDFDLEPLSYRMGILLGIQPEVAEAYLAQSGLGWPQRLLWTTVHGAIEDAERIHLEPLAWKRPPDPERQTEIDVDQAVWDEVKAAALAYRNSDGADELDSHLGLLRLKVAAALHVLINPGDAPAVTVEDWLMAGEIVLASSEVRDGARRRVAQAATEKVAQVARVQAAAQVQAHRAIETEAVRRVAGVITRKALRHAAADPEHWCAKRECLRDAVASRDKDLFAYAVDYALEAGLLAEAHGPDGERYRPGPSADQDAKETES